MNDYGVHYKEVKELKKRNYAYGRLCRFKNNIDLKIFRGLFFFA